MTADSTIAVLVAFVLVLVTFWIITGGYERQARARALAEQYRRLRARAQNRAVLAARARNATPTPRGSDFPRRSER